MWCPPVHATTTVSTHPSTHCCPSYSYTSHHDPTHCFAETRDGTVAVTVIGDWLPRHVFGYLHAVCAYVRMIYLAMIVICFTPGVHVYICDQVSACVPVLRLGDAKILFYCHFPDLLLAKKTSWLKDMYVVACSALAVCLSLFLRASADDDKHESIFDTVAALCDVRPCPCGTHCCYGRYRAPLNWLEEKTTGMAHMVMVRATLG